MLRNVGTIDAWIRGALAVALFLGAVLLNQYPVISLAAALAALVSLGTALTRSCPLYHALHLSTGRHAKRP